MAAKKKAKKRSSKSVAKRIVLSQQALIFARHFSTHADPVRAAMAAGVGRREDGGWNMHEAEDAAVELLNRPAVAEYIGRLNTEQNSWFSNRVDADKVHALLDGMLLTNYDDFFIYDAESGSYVAKPPHLLSPIEKAAVKDYRQRTYTGRDGETINEVYVSLIDKSKILALKAKASGLLDGPPPVDPDEAAQRVRAALIKLEETEGVEVT